MSETVIVKGTARCMNLMEMIAEFPADIMELYPGDEFQCELTEYLDSKRLYDDYHVRRDRVYKLDMEVRAPADYFAENNGSKDGTICFHYMYYNGGCDYGELLDDYIDSQE